MPPGKNTITVRVVPNAKKTELIGRIDGGALKVKLASPTVDGKANRALVEFLAKQLGVPQRTIAIVRGEKSRTKVICLDGIDADSACSQPAAAVVRAVRDLGSTAAAAGSP